MGRNVIPKITIAGDIILRNVISYLETNTSHFKRHAYLYILFFPFRLLLFYNTFDFKVY